jgi:hypothetical protein
MTNGPRGLQNGAGSEKFHLDSQHAQPFSRVSDPHSLYADQNSAYMVNADPDPALKMNADPNPVEILPNIF